MSTALDAQPQAAPSVLSPRAEARGAASRRGPLAIFGAPGAIWLLLFIVIPYGGVLVFSFFKTDYVDLIPAFTLHNLDRVASDAVVHTVLLRTALIAVAVTTLSFCIALPLAYIGAFYVRRKALFVFLIVAPMFVSYIVRLYSWRLLLGDHGVVNRVLIDLGIVDKPLGFMLFSPWAVIVTLTYVYMPFMFVSLFSVMEGLDRRLLHAAADLYASPWRRFTRVTLPLVRPGIAAGVMFVFPLAFGDYIAPSLVGGTQGQMLANLVQNQFGTTFDYPFGAALALMLLVIVMAVVTLLDRWRMKDEVAVF